MKPSLILETTWRAAVRAVCLGLVALGFLPSLRAGQFGQFSYHVQGDAVEISYYPRDAVGPVEIPAVIDGLPVTSIGSHAFMGCTGLSSVTLPNSLTYMGYYSFADCTRLTSMTIPSSITSIGFAAFSGCTSLTEITVGAGNSFYCDVNGVLFNKSTNTLIQCPRAKAGSYTIPNSVTSIGELAFFGCHGLTSVTIPSSVTSIGGWLPFSGCTSLTAINVEAGNPTYASEGGVLLNAARTFLLICPAGKTGAYTIPSHVTEIAFAAFYGCTGLSAINVEAGNPTYASEGGLLLNATRAQLILCPPGRVGHCSIPASVTSIDNQAFYGCTQLTNINVEAGNPTYASESGVLLDATRARLIRCPPGRVGHYSIPASVTTIDLGAFSGCTGLTSVTIPSGVTSSSAYYYYEANTYRGAFSDCTGLTNVTLQQGLTTIGEGMFSGCTKLTSITIPSSVTSIGYSAFSGCTSLTAIEVMSGGPVVDGNTLSIRLLAETDGLWCYAETSTDLIHWTTTGVTTSVTGPNGLRTASVPMNGPKRFMRVVVIPRDPPPRDPNWGFV